jgi:hypothetical protein
MKVHLSKDKKRAWCGQVIRFDFYLSNDIDKVECATCVDAFHFDKGKLPEWKIGGSYDKNGSIRKNAGQGKRKR